MSGPDFRDTTAIRELLRPAYLAGERVEPGPVLDALDHAERLLADSDAAYYQRQCHRLQVEAERLRAAVRGVLGDRARHWTDAELIEALHALSGESS